MATFDPGVASIDPKNTERNFSQGTNSLALQPLAEVPKLSEKYVQPDYKANTSTGKGIAEAGTELTAGLGLADAVIKQNVSETLVKGFTDVQNSFGVAQATDTANQPGGLAQQAGAAGADGVSLSGDTGAGATPLPLQKLGTRLDGLTEMYKNGDLSNSAYYAKMNAVVAQVKQQFPGFSDDVDSITKDKLGVLPANAVRSALQQDVTELQKKVQAQNDKITTWRRDNAAYIYSPSAYPNFDQLQADGKAPSQAELEATVGKLKARDQAYTSGVLALNAQKQGNAAKADGAADILTRKAGDIANEMVLSIPNQLGIKTPQDFTKLLQDVQSGKRAPLTPDEKQQLTGVFATMQQQYGITFDKFANDHHSIAGGPTVASYVSDPAKVLAIRGQGMQSIADMKDALLNDNYGVIAQTANWSKATNDAAEGDFLRRSPVAASVAAGRKLYGDQGITQLMISSPPLMSAALEGFRQFNQGKIAEGNGSLQNTFDTIRNEKVNDGNLNRATISDTVETIFHPEKTNDPQNAAQKAVQHAFGPDNRTLLDAFATKDQVGVFTQLTSPTMTKKIAKMDKTSQDTYTSWADTSFTSVFEAQAAEANNVTKNFATNSNMTLKYDPDTSNFSFDSAFRLPPYAAAKLQGLNTAINSMKDVFKLEGKDPTAALYNLLPAAGIEPGSPIYRAVQTEFLKAQTPGK